MKRRHPLAKCEECEWFKPTNGYVPNHGPENADVLVIGESPGRAEVETGIPFTGPTGQLLDMTMSHYGFNRESLRLANAVGCHPPFLPGEGAQEPPRSVVDACAPRLQAELETSRKAVFLMGNTASKAVQGDWSRGIMKRRQGAPTLNQRGAWEVATVHPAACLRNPDQFPSFKKDVKKLANIIKGNNIYIKWEPPNYVAHDDIEKAIQVLKHLMYDTGDLLVLDIETGVEKDSSFTHPKEWLSIGFSYAQNKAVVLGTECLKNYKVRQMIGELLDRKKVICHNGKYDLQVLMRIGIPFRPRLYADTMLASYVLDERPGHHGLKALSSEWLGAPDYEADIKKYVKSGQSYALIPRDKLYKYNAYDCALTYNLWTIFEAEMSDELRKLHDRLCELSVELIYVEFDGVEVDQKYMDELTEDYLQDIYMLEKGLSPWLENPRSVPQVKKAMEELNLPNETTGAKELKRLLNIPEIINEDDYERLLYNKVTNGSESERFLALLLMSRKEYKLYGTYVKGAKERMLDGRVYPTYMVHGTVSGRLSCRNPNLQNLPRLSKIKRLYVPSYGNTFVQCDYGQAELRVIACLAKDPYLKEVFTDDSRDIHGEVADVLFGKGKWNKEDRVRAKSYVFGSFYGLAPYTIALSYGISELQAKREQYAFFKMVPQTMKWRRDVHASLFRDKKTPTTPLGRRRRFSLMSKEVKEKIGKEVWAFYPQSIASDINLTALVRIRQAFGWEPTGPKLRMTVHDSIVAECPDDIKHDVANLMTNIMKETASEIFSDYVPFKVDPEFGYSYGDLFEDSEKKLVEVEDS